VKKTKIICTIGPSSETKETLKELLKSGMNMMRLNFSHGNYEEHKEKIDNFWKALFKAIDEDKKVALQNWGVFEKKERKARKVLMPMWEKAGYTEPKEAVKFKAGKALVKIANGDKDE